MMVNRLKECNITERFGVVHALKAIVMVNWLKGMQYYRKVHKINY